MSFRTLTAKYDGTCKRCREEFPAGTKIRYGGYGRTYHFKDDCPAGGGSSPNSDYTPSGGLCEDAPCCGHKRCGFGPSSPGYGSNVNGSPYYGEGV